MMPGPVPSGRTVRVLVALAILTLIAVLAWLLFQVVTLSGEAHDARARETSAKTERSDLLRANATQDTAIKAQQEAIAKANAELRKAGKPTVPVPAVSPPATVPAVPSELVANAVAAYMAAHPLKAGADGPTMAQVVAAVMPAVTQQVAAYQAAHPAKNGTDGKTGPPGAPGAGGADGTDGKDGADAPPPTQEQVNAAVAAYCDAHDHCQGPTGTAGTDGKDAYPFTFSYTVPARGPFEDDRTYTCTITDPATPATCTTS